jgi:hypothetical protein
MTKTYKISIFIFVTIFMLPGTAFSQTKIQVVTRTISKVFIYKPGSTFEIKAEKASIQVKKSTDNTIKVKLQLISKNPSQHQAEKDLKYCDYQITESNDQILLSNFFNSKDQFKEISSNLNAKYEIEIPSGVTLKIKNIYGNMDMTKVQGNFNVSVDFCQVKLSDIDGTIFINSKYTDINGQNIIAATDINAQKGDIVFTNTKNILKIKDQYGSISLDNIYANVNVDAEMTAININLNNPATYSLDFTTVEGEIIAQERFNKMVISKQGEEKLITSGGKISIKVATTYNSITLKTK